MQQLELFLLSASVFVHNKQNLSHDAKFTILALEQQNTEGKYNALLHYYQFTREILFMCVVF